MDKIWLKNYPAGVPHDVDPDQYRSAAHLLEEAMRKHAASPFSVCMERWMSYGELDRHSAALGAWLQGVLGFRQQQFEAEAAVFQFP